MAASSVRSLFLLGEAVCPNFVGKWTLIRMVVDEDFARTEEDVDAAGGVRGSEQPCETALKWLNRQREQEQEREEKIQNGGGKFWRIRTSPLVFSCLVYELKKSRNFRTKVLDGINWRRAASSRRRENSSPPSLQDERFVTACQGSCGDGGHLNVRIRVIWKGPLQMDAVWNYHLERLLRQRIELDEMLAGLSTLGGAFSSLGDQHLDCAETAGLISLRQMQIARRLGDPPLVARCKLFLALSLMQRGWLRGAERLIRSQFAVAKGLPEKQRDVRLEKMCKGAWAKLQYIHGRRRTLAKIHQLRI